MASGFQQVFKPLWPGLGPAPRQTWLRHTGQHTAFGLFFGRQTWPLDGVAHRAAHQLAQAGAARAVAAGARQLHPRHLGRFEQRQIAFHVELQIGGQHPCGEGLEIL